MRISDWSSDVCSSDLCHQHHCIRGVLTPEGVGRARNGGFGLDPAGAAGGPQYKIVAAAMLAGVRVLGPPGLARAALQQLKFCRVVHAASVVLRIRLTCADNTPPSACTKALRRGLESWRASALLLSWRQASTMCAMPPATPEWPNDSRPPWVFKGSAPSGSKSPWRRRWAALPLSSKPSSSRPITTVMVKES